MLLLPLFNSEGSVITLIDLSDICRKYNVIDYLRSFLSIALRIFTAHNFTRDYLAHIKKMTAFSLWPELARKVNRHFLVNEYGDLSFFLFFELDNNFFL